MPAGFRFVAAPTVESRSIRHVADLLGETLEEEKETDEKLTELAESSVTAEAETAGADDK